MPYVEMMRMRSGRFSFFIPWTRPRAPAKATAPQMSTSPLACIQLGATGFTGCRDGFREVRDAFEQRRAAHIRHEGSESYGPQR